MRRSVKATYERMCERLGNPEDLSLRKQFCFQYVKWGFQPSKENRAKFIELAKRWRLEGDRIGRARTLLERKARKLFKTVRKHKNLEASRQAAKAHGEMQKEKKIGIHSEELRQKRREQALLSVESRRKSGRYSNAHYTWKATNEETGEVTEAPTLRMLSEKVEVNLNTLQTAEKKGTPHKGWRCEKFNREW